MSRNMIDIPFPFGGINKDASHRFQPEGTTHDALNVRPYDGISHKRRGSQRGGLSKYYTSQLNGSNAIQMIDSISLALDPGELTADTLILGEDFSSYTSNGLLQVLNPTRWPECYLGSTLGGTSGGSSYGLNVNSSTDSIQSATSDGVRGEIGVLTNSLSLTSVYDIRAHFKTGTYSSSSAWRISHSVNIYFRVNPNISDGTSGTKDYFNIRIYPDTPDSTKYNLSGVVMTNAVGGSLFTTISGGTLPGGLSWGMEMIFRITVNGDDIRIYINDYLLKTVTNSTHNIYFKVGFGLGGTWPNYWCQTGSGDFTDFYVYTAKPLATTRTTKVIAASGGNVYMGDSSSLSLLSSGAVKATGYVSSVGAYQKSYLCDGYSANYRVIDYSSGVLSSWTPTTGALPTGGSTLIESMSTVTISNSTTIIFSSATGLSNGEHFEIRNSSDNDGSYRVTNASGDPTIVFTPALSNTSDTTGSAYEGSYGAKYATLYRGRIVLYGLHTDPHNWFMSASGNPLDWDYSPSTISSTMAVAGNNSDAGKIGDVIRCCAPFSDDLMIMGGDHTLWVMRGDPASGGVIDNISYQVGIAGPRAYTFDPTGNMYFFGTGGLWRLAAGATSSPEPISQGRMDSVFPYIDLNTYEPVLLWDDYHKGFHMLLIPVEEPSSAPIHYWYDERTDGIWKDQYPVSYGPVCSHMYDADDPDDKAIMLGCWDGYIRYIDNGKADDDGTAISSYCWFTPIISNDVINNKLQDVRVIMDSSSNDIRLEIHAAEDVETLNESTTAIVSKTISGGRNSPIIQTVNGNAINIKLINDSSELRTWAVESISGMIGQGGIQRNGRL